jgi:hypothetical protein
MFFAEPSANGWADRARLRPKDEIAKKGDTP